MLLDLFISFFQVGLLSFGGGYAALPLIQNQIVNVHAWIDVTEFADIVTISQMTPGPIALNAASFVGSKMCGIPGTVVATAAVVTAPLIISLTLAYFYFKYRQLDVMKGILYGLRPTVVSLIASAGLSILLQVLFNSATFPIDPEQLSFISLALFIIAFTILLFRKLSPILVILLSGGAYLTITLLLT
ncbi:MAG: chromate transporter [Sphaerochaetaceae bacterium]